MLQDTFARAKTWVKELQRQASPSIVIALAGNKADIANKRMIEFDVSSQNVYFGSRHFVFTPVHSFWSQLLK